jgi:hypothetical protein
VFLSLVYAVVYLLLALEQVQKVLRVLLVQQ